MNKITLRNVTERDRGRLLKWRNDPIQRRNSTTMHVISSGEHSTWFEEMMCDPDHFCWVAEENDIPVGVVRFNKRQWGLYEVAWSIAAEYRGRGLGSKMVKMAVEDFKRPVCARVKIHNILSEKVAQRAGFLCIYKTEDYSYWFLSMVVQGGIL